MNFTINDNRLDANQNVFLNTELQSIRSRLYEEVLGPTKGRSLVVVTGEVPAGAETDTYNVMASYGKANVGGTAYSTTAPRADVSRRQVSNSIVPITNAYGYNLNEIRKSAQAGIPLAMYKGRAAKTANEQTVDRLLLIGDAAEGLAGLFNLSGALAQTISTGAAGLTFDLKTSDEIVADLFSMENYIIENSLEALAPNTMVLPLSSYNLIKTRRMRDGSDVTILKYFLGLSEQINRIESSSRLESNAAWSGKRAMAYDNNPLSLEAVIPVEFEQLPPQAVNYETIINCHSRFGGIRLYQPKSVVYMDGL